MTKDEIIDVLEDRLSEAVRSKNFDREWYGTRFERLKDLCKEAGIWDKAACIIANGSVSSSEPADYWSQLNVMRHRAEAAERELAKLGGTTPWMRKST
jgi:hypothetical protein